MNEHGSRRIQQLHVAGQGNSLSFFREIPLAVPEIMSIFATDK
jgi:hypothetical protein